jgi:hypothetical protein
VNSGIRKGILPQMLQEILDTRLMVIIFIVRTADSCFCLI